MSQNKKLKRSHRQKKKKKKQTMRRSSTFKRESSGNDELQFTLMNDGRMKVTVSEEKMPKFLINAQKAIKLGRIEQAKALINDENLKIVHQLIKKDPSNIGVMYILAMTLATLGRTEEAEKWYENIIKIEPNWAVYNELANIKEKKQQYADEMDYRQKALQDNPDNSVVLNNYGMHLVRMGRAEEGTEILRKAVQKTSDNPVVHSNLVFFMHYLPQIDYQAMFEAHKKWAQEQAPVDLARTSHDNNPDPDRRLRIGYVSPDFRLHSVQHFFEILLDEQNHQAVENYGYSNLDCPDEVTERLKSKFDHFRDIYGVSDEAVIDMIEKDKIDIFVDLAGHTGNNRLPLLAHKPAPIQVTYLGYPDTTGMEQIDYRFTDELADPPGSQQFYTEELVYLPDGFLSYKPPDFAPPVRPLPVLKNGYITFGSFNNNCKINPFIMTIWAEVLKANEKSRFIIKFRGGQDKMLQQHYFREFEKLGIGPNRIEIHGGLSPAEHMNLYNRIDIALDTYPYNGTTTTFEALWMGVPVISLVGPHHMSRVGLSILTRFGMGFLAADTPENYLIRATTLAAKTDTLAEMRAVLRRTIAGSVLCNTAKFVENVEAEYRKMWHKWCEKQGVKVTHKEVTAYDKTCSIETAVCSEASVEQTSSHAEDKEQTDTSQKPIIRIFHNLARAGGTLVCKCIGSMENTVLLSEIHPLGSQYYDPVSQAHQWYKLLTDEDMKNLKKKEFIDFVDAIRLIHKRCIESGQKLLIRDWAHLDFVAVPFLKKPSYKMILADALAPFFNVLRLALVRHPLDQWLSLSRVAPMQGKLTVKMFLRGYLKYAEQAAEIGYVRYEDFTAKPFWQMKIICQKLQLDYDQSFINKWYDYKEITGDAVEQSRGMKICCIQQLPRRPVPPELLKHFHENDDYWQALKLLNYQDVQEEKSYIKHPTISIDEAINSSVGEKTKERKINARRIFISSMQRAGSMWTYNVTRALIHSTGLETIPKSVPTDTAPFITRAFTEPIGENEVFCIKTHFVVQPPEGDSRTLIISPYRDIRDCIVSYMKFRHSDFEYAIRAMKQWDPTGVYFERQTDNILIIRYDRIVNEPLDTIRKIDSFIGTGASFKTIEEINEQFSRKKVKQKVDGLKDISSSKILANAATLDAVENEDGSYRPFDKSTGFQAGHITSQKDGQWREILTEEQKQRLMQETAGWLEKYGFEL